MCAGGVILAEKEAWRKDPKVWRGRSSCVDRAISLVDFAEVPSFLR
jgi:hypothetical protein